ncbi:exonuclease RecJ [Desulfotomaculum arcticum]|uniref:Single-stranded-DNA-specific exonuclease RecJ n=1 Tax=Desulfotruncus arcticus DSM 17038 TaxID=1121424 RepID=A0A1I2ZKA5_9FIRM|nr:single-stranded-DNA-specific exonuclease RecJ [Desulfotruncus arcticus]SFH37551.1 exonuclease RecJ [Desulfotomaculum arcticum] [Desulfotruncus arcticus DSM 17038]
MNKTRRWLVKKTEPVLQLIFVRKLGVSPLMAQLLVNRGIYTLEAARDFLETSMQRLHPPALMKDLTAAVEITIKALQQGNKILIYGDYDVDGVTSTALLVEIIRRLEGNVDYYIPHRIAEGYGLHTGVLQKFHESGVDLVITVDCGISAVAEVAAANKSGGPLIIITDHHEPPSELPAAAAVVNPKRKDCSYPFRDLAGVGVAFKFGQALLERAGMSNAWEEYLDFVCLGTIADIVSLTGENRILVRHGLPRLAGSARPGLQALFSVAGIKEETLGTREVGFMLAPRINAAGRMGDASLAVELLLCRKPDRAMEIAAILNRENQERQQMETMVLAEALGMLDGEPRLAEQKVLVLASLNWHPGVIGIVASKLTDRFYKPVLLIACQEDGQGKGSARSIEGFNLYQALEFCADTLLGFGGHAMAAGFSVETGKIDEFRDKINSYAERVLTEEIQSPVLELDALISLEDITYDLVNEIEQLQPYGHGNPGPMFGMSGVKLVNCRGVGKKNAHLKMLLRQSNKVMDGIGFNLGKFAGELAAGKDVSVAFTPSVNSWQGRQTLQVEVRDLQKPGTGVAENLDHRSLQDDSMRLADDLVLVPESLAGALKNILISQSHNIPPELKMLKALFSADAVPATEPPQCGSELHSAGRTGIISRLAVKEGRTILLVNCARQTLQIYRHLKDYNRECADKLAYIHGFMPPETVNHELASVEQGETGIAIGTYGSITHLDNWGEIFGRVILVSPPATEVDWAVAGRFSGQLEALYTTGDWEENRRHLQEIAPERDVLALFYALLRANARNGEGVLRKPTVIAALVREGVNISSSITITVAAAVFAELNLLQYQWQNGMLKYKLLPSGSQKRDLMESPIYVGVRNIKAKGLEWISRALN